MAALTNIVVLPIVAFILVHGASIYTIQEFTCGSLRCPSGTVGCAVNVNTNANNQSTVTEMCLGSSGNTLSKSSKIYSNNQVPSVGLWWNNNSTWGNGTGFWNWTRTHLKVSSQEHETKLSIQSTLGNIENDINRIKNLLH